MSIAIKNALISVSDKTDIIPFAQFLSEHGVHLISTGGTFKLLKENDIEVTEISQYTGFPEIMDGRVKTLHPKVHGGILGRLGQDEAVMQAHDIPKIDLVVVNLYPFANTIAKPDVTFDEAIENIDIGGPTMVRATAKNHAFTTICTSPSDYPTLMDEMRSSHGKVSTETRFELAVKAFKHTAEYDGLIARYLDTQLNKTEESSFPIELNLSFTQKEILRYGENSHQRAAFYTEQGSLVPSISTAVQHQGKALSYNNIADTDAALECVKQFTLPACVIVKHANPCGVAVADNLLEAYEKAFATDPESSFGGIIAFNQRLDAKTAQTIIDKQFVEVIIAPALEDGVSDIVASKKNVRLLTTGAFEQEPSAWDYKRVNGGVLMQDRDDKVITAEDLTVVSARKPSPAEIADLLFAWKVAKFVKSNAIVYAKDSRTVGVGAGQMSRVNSARIAEIKAEHAGLTVPGSVMASDAFFPFRDGIDNAAQAGIRAVIQPGGSIRDEEVIAAANEADMAMVFTGVRHFRH